MSESFHEGERAEHARAGVREKAGRIARMITGKLDDKARACLATTQLVVLATLDETDQPWASLLTGDRTLHQLVPPVGPDLRLGRRGDLQHDEDRE